MPPPRSFHITLSRMKCREQSSCCHLHSLANNNPPLPFTPPKLSSHTLDSFENVLWAEPQQSLYSADTRSVGGAAWKPHSTVSPNAFPTGRWRPVASRQDSRTAQQPRKFGVYLKKTTGKLFCPSQLCLK